MVDQMLQNSMKQFYASNKKVIFIQRIIYIFNEVIILIQRIIYIMEVTTSEMIATRIPLINLMTTIYLINHLKRQLIDFLKKYHALFM